MLILFNLLLISFIGGQVLSYSFASGIRVSALDISLGIFLIWCFMAIRKSVQFTRMYLEYFGVFFAICILSLLLQIGRLSWTEMGISALYLLRFIEYTLIYPILNLLPDKEKEINLRKLWTVGLMVAILGLIQYLLYPNLRNLAYLGWDPHHFRVFSTFLDPNFTGIILVLTLVLGIYLFKHLKLTVWLLGQILCFAALLLTYSRGSFTALGVGFVAWILFNKFSLTRKIGLICLIGIIFSISLWLLPRPGGEGVNLLRVISVESRIENNREAFSLFLKSPVIGWGFNTLRFVRNQTVINSHSGAGFHNGWFFIMTTTGILGFAAYLWIWWRLLENNQSSLICKKQILIISVLVVFVHNLFDNSLFYPPVMFWLMVLTGSINHSSG